MSYSDCHRALPAIAWRQSLIECLLGALSQLSAHTVCILTALSNLAVGSVSIAAGHDLYSTILLGIAMYAASIGMRFLWGRDNALPSLKLSTLGLAFGIAVAGGLDRVQIYDHRQELTDWYLQLPNGERQQIREKVHHWIEKQSNVQRKVLAEAATLMGYESAEDYVVLNYCSPSNRELTALWENVGGTSRRWP